MRIVLLVIVTGVLLLAMAYVLSPRCVPGLPKEPRIGGFILHYEGCRQ